MCLAVARMLHASCACEAAACGALASREANRAELSRAYHVISWVTAWCAQDDGTRVSVSEFLEQTFGFRYSYMGVVIATLAAFSVGMWLATVASLRCAALGVLAVSYMPLHVGSITAKLVAVRQLDRGSVLECQQPSWSFMFNMSHRFLKFHKR